MPGAGTWWVFGGSYRLERSVPDTATLYFPEPSSRVLHDAFVAGSGTCKEGRTCSTTGAWNNRPDRLISPHSCSYDADAGNQPRRECIVLDPSLRHIVAR